MAGTSSGSMLTRIIMFFLCEIYALVVAVFGGSLVDILEDTFDKAGMFVLSDPEQWNFDAYAQMVNMFYFTPYVMALLSIVIIVMTIWQRHGRDREAAEERNEYSNDSEI